MQSKTFRENRFHPKRLAEALEPTTKCLACGYEVTVLGDASGVCGRCGEPRLTPQGTLSITGQHADENWDGGATLTLDARDDSGRAFSYTIEVGDGDPELRAVEIAGRRVTPDSPYWDAEALWVGTVEKAVAEYERGRDEFYAPLFGGDEA